jgi:hypothetical protein
LSQSQGFNLSVKLTVGNGTSLNNSTDKAGNGSSNFTIRASLPPSVVAQDVDVQLKVIFPYAKLKYLFQMYT